MTGKENGSPRQARTAAAAKQIAPSVDLFTRRILSFMMAMAMVIVIVIVIVTVTW